MDRDALIKAGPEDLRKDLESLAFMKKASYIAGRIRDNAEVGMMGSSNLYSASGFSALPYLNRYDFFG